jgi:hypothetical protein
MQFVDAENFIALHELWKLKVYGELKVRGDEEVIDYLKVLLFSSPGETEETH